MNASSDVTGPVEALVYLLHVRRFTYISFLWLLRQWVLLEWKGLVQHNYLALDIHICTDKKHRQVSTITKILLRTLQNVHISGSPSYPGYCLGLQSYKHSWVRPRVGTWGKKPNDIRLFHTDMCLLLYQYLRYIKRLSPNQLTGWYHAFDKMKTWYISDTSLS